LEESVEGWWSNERLYTVKMNTTEYVKSKSIELRQQITINIIKFNKLELSNN